MKKIFQLIVLFVFVVSCVKDTTEDPIPNENNMEENVVLINEGNQVFRVNLKGLEAGKNSNKNLLNLEPAFALISISDNDDKVILTREKVKLLKEDDTYITEDISLEAGTYKLTEFIVIDAEDVIISLVPKEDSVLAQYATSTLPFNFDVSADETKETETENINAAGYTSVDFGYTGLSLTFPENTDFFSLTVDDSNSLTNKIINIKSVTGSTFIVDWGDENVEEYVSTIENSGLENEISHTYSENGIYTINISGAIEAIEVFEFKSNQENSFESHITSVNIEKLILLKSIEIYTGLLTSIDVSKNTNLVNLEIGNNRLSSIDLSNNPKLELVRLRDNELTTLNVSQNPNINWLSVSGNQLATIDLSQNINLLGLAATQNNLSTIDLSNNPNLTQLDLSFNLISSIDVSSNTQLVNFNLGANQISSIDLSKNTNLVRIDLFFNQIGTVDLTSNSKLEKLYIQDNLVTEIDLSSNVDLERLIIENNNLTNLDISANPMIFNLEIGGNQFNGMQLDQMLSGVYDQAVLNGVMNGYVDYQNNPGFDTVAATTLAKLNELVANYNWSFNNNN